MSKQLMKGNEAIAEAAIRAGVEGFFAYPITPQNEIGEYMSYHLPKAGGVFVQAESELGAINMVFGGAALGKRVMTSSSGPGMSLKQEGISSIASAMLPAVVVNMMRGGPGLGNIGPSQGDYFQATKGGGHGDYHMIVLAPSTVQELVDLTIESFDLAEKYRIIVNILGDGVLGQMMEPVEFKQERSAPRTEEQIEELFPWALTGAKDREPNLVQSLHLHGDTLYDFNMEQKKVWDKIIANEQRIEMYQMEDAEYTVAAFGSTARITKTTVRLARDQGIKLGLMRPISLWPFPDAEILQQLERNRLNSILAVEMNLGQMVADVRLVVEGRVPVEFFGSPGGRMPTPEEILEQVKILIS